jgi:acyl carrier protein
MNKNQLKKIIKKSIDSKEVANIESGAWDSLAHLNILMELEKIFPRKIASIDGIAEANNYKNLENILISKKILLND